MYGAYVCSVWYACMRVLSLLSAGGLVEAARPEKVTAAEYEEQVAIVVNLLRCLVRLLPCTFFFFLIIIIIIILLVKVHFSFLSVLLVVL